MKAIQKETDIKHIIVVNPEVFLDFPKSLIVKLVSRLKFKSAEMKEKGVGLKECLTQWKNDGKKTADMISFEEALKLGRKSTFQKVHITPEDTACIQYTGGTTGVSKGAVLTHRNILSNIEQVRLWFKTQFNEGEEVAISPLPLYHIFAFTVNLFTFSVLGVKNILIMNQEIFQALSLL